ncbi:hypothetical protein NXW94_16325 [Bacteroides ovatus]|nr:hypothetical protein [Bacteroides ovatus]
MRIFLLFFPVFFFCGLLHAQTVKVEYGGDPLPDKDRKKIEQFLQHEVDFYSQFGLPDTLSLQLYVFENRREAIDYLESINVSLPIKASGAYSPKLQKGSHLRTGEWTGEKSCHYLSRTESSFRFADSRQASSKLA